MASTSTLTPALPPLRVMTSASSSWRDYKFERITDFEILVHDGENDYSASFEVGTKRSTLFIKGRTEHHNSHYVQRTRCTCGNCEGITYLVSTSVLSRVPRPSSPAERDASSPSGNSLCVLGSGYNPEVCPSLDAMSAFFQRRGAKNERDVLQSRVRLGGSLYNPEQHPEWCTHYNRPDRWAGFLGIRHYMSNKEIDESLVEFDGMGDTPEYDSLKYLFLCRCGLWNRIVNKLGSEDEAVRFFAQKPNGDDIRALLGIPKRGASAPREPNPTPKEPEELLTRARLPFGAYHHSDMAVLHRGYTMQQLWKIVECEGVRPALRKVKQETDNPLCTEYGRHLAREFKDELRGTMKAKKKQRSWVSAHAVFQTKKAIEEGRNMVINASEPGVGKTRSVFAITSECFPSSPGVPRNFLILAPDANCGTQPIAHDLSRVAEGGYWISEAFKEGEFGKFIVANNRNAASLASQLDPSGRNFIIVTEYKLQNASDMVFDTSLLEALATIEWDVIVVDELQIWTGTGLGNSGKRRVPNLSHLLSKSPNSFRYLMSATMVRTSVREAASALEKFSGMSNDICLINGDSNLAAMIQLRIEYLRHGGFRFVANPELLPKMEGVEEVVDGNIHVHNSSEIPGLIEVHLLNGDALPSNINWKSVGLDAEWIATTHKVAELANNPTLRDLVKRSVNPMFVTTFVGGIDEQEQVNSTQGNSIIDAMGQMCRNLGYTNCFEYTGREKAPYSGCKDYRDSRENLPSYLERMLARHEDVATIASLAAVSTALDGLQRGCDTLVVIASPYTYSSLCQLIGRIRRRGCVFESIRVIVIIADYIEYDVSRWRRVVERKEGDDCYLEGILNRRDAELAREKYKLYSKENRYLPHVEMPGANLIDANLKLHIPSYRRTYSGIAHDHSQWSRLGWKQPRVEYHTTNSAQNQALGPSAPWQRIYAEHVYPLLEQTPTAQILDLGCGLDSPTKHKGSGNFTFVDADLHLPNDLGILKVDRRNTGLPSGKFDVIVSSLSLFKKIAEDSILEMRRLLAPGGTIVIVESHRDKKWVRNSLPKLFDRFGFDYTIGKVGDDKHRFRKYTLVKREQ